MGHQIEEAVNEDCEPKNERGRILNVMVLQEIAYVHGKPAHQAAKYCSSIESRVDCTNYSRGIIGIEVIEEVIASNNIGHHTSIITKEEGSGG